MIADLMIGPSDVGLRREDSEEVMGAQQFCVVADTGVGGGYLHCQTDWRTPAQLRDYAARIIAAAELIEAQ